MLRFNQMVLTVPNVCGEFQYILCYGSTAETVYDEVLVDGFQYILCYGSTGYITMQDPSPTNFNTSYVTVQLLRSARGIQIIHISIHPMLRFNLFPHSPLHSLFRISIHPMLRFNVERI